jgi:putative phosphoribosyl transferase
VIASLSEGADEVICLATPEPFYAVGLWYRDFTQTTDQEVVDLLARAARAAGAERSPGREAAARGDRGARR